MTGADRANGGPGAAGGLGGPAPIDAALACLREGHGERHQGRVFSSDLTVDEAILLKEVDYEPRGLVMASVIYHVGYTFGMLGQNTEVTALSEAMAAARVAVNRRLVEEARQVGGDGVVGVRLTIEMFEPSRHLMEFVAIGTAVAAGPDALPRRQHRPFTSDLSGQDFYLLQRAGYEPLGLVMGSCVYHVARQGVGRWVANQGQNVELEGYTQAFYEARELAMGRLHHQARQLKAEGVVGVTTTQGAHTWGSRAIEFSATGTAVRLVEDEHRRLDPRPVVPLDDPVVATDPRAITTGQRGRRGGSGLDG
ncbi:MAG TPA: heavy metal-binding domain-containing protein [Acidimicrobiales bacterium]|nr:heavy metal-binding domain-containing protein [Acidimicrobiales bacterium]